MEEMQTQRIYLAALVYNRTGVLLRVAGLFARRGYNVVSLTVSETESPEFSRMTIVSDVEPYKFTMVEQQLSRLEDVIKVIRLDTGHLVSSELLLIKVHALNKDRTRVLKTIDITKDVEDITKKVSIKNTSFNVLISGMDSYGTINKTTRNDVNMIATVNPNTNKVLLTSIPRDYYVQLHGKTGYKDKLTHAGIYGINTVVQTIEDLFGIDINYYVRVNFTTVESLVNTIGPIEIYSDKAMSLDGCKYVVGTNTVNGKCALRFARERHSYVEGDNHRIKNQQEVIKGIFNKLSKSAMVVTDYTSILNSLDGKFATNMDMKDITAFIKYELEDITKYEILDTQVTGTGSMELTYSYPHQKLYVMFPSEQSVESAKEYINKISNEK